jgi:hypothetical protein
MSAMTREILRSSFLAGMTTSILAARTVSNGICGKYSCEACQNFEAGLKDRY